MMANDSIRIVSPIPESYFAEVVQFMENTYDIEEPINIALGPRTEAAVKDYNAYHFNTLKEEISAMALDNNNKVIGALTAGVTQKNKYEEDNMSDERLKLSFDIMIPYELLNGLYEQYDINELCELRAMSVDKKYRGKNFGLILSEKVIDIALAKGLKVVICYVSSPFSKQICQKLGFETAYESKLDKYLEVKLKNGDNLFVYKPMYNFIEIMLRDYRTI